MHWERPVICPCGSASIEDVDERVGSLVMVAWRAAARWIDDHVDLDRRRAGYVRGDETNALARIVLVLEHRFALPVDHHEERESGRNTRLNPTGVRNFRAQQCCTLAGRQRGVECGRQIDGM